MGSLRGLISLTVIIVDFRFVWGRQAYCGRPTKKLAQCCGVATDCSSRFWRQGSIVFTFFFRRGGTAQKLRMRDSRSWNWRALIWETGVRVYDGSLYCVRLSTLIHWHYFFGIFADWVGYFWHWIFDTLSFEKHSKGGVILSRSSQSWENLKFDTMLTLTKVGEDPQVAQHQIYHRIMCFRLPTPGGVSVKHQMSVCQASR
jgi:hypothetical protein